MLESRRGTYLHICMSVHLSLCICVRVWVGEGGDRGRVKTFTNQDSNRFTFSTGHSIKQDH